MKIAVIGAGAFGTALGGILAEKGHDIDYYDSKVEREKLSDVLKGAKLIVLAVPSKAVPYLLPHLPKNIPMIVATKGILSESVFNEFNDFMVLSGPGFADDIKGHKQTILTATDIRVIELFQTGYLSFDYTDDCQGVLMCGALKNVYALLAGILGLERDSAEWVEFIDEVVTEMREVLAANGGKRETVDLVCGVGDLRLTCGLPSRNYEFGSILRRDPTAKPEKTVEGISALNKIKRGEIKVPAAAKNLQNLIERSKEWA